MLFFCWLPFWCCMPFALTETKNLAEGAFPVSATGSVGEEFALRTGEAERPRERTLVSAKGGEAGST